jgi:hypothetical protein
MKKIKSSTVWVAIWLITHAASAWSDDSEIDDATDRGTTKFDFKPVVLDSENTGSSTLGIQYEFSDTLFYKNFDTKDAESCVTFPCPHTVLGSAKLTYDLKGVFTENANNNPKNFIESNLNGSYLKANSDSKFIWSGGVFVKYEADQKFKNKQLVYGLNGAVSSRDTFHSNDFAFIQINVGTVDPSDDTSREAILGENSANYDRINVEFVYRFTINKGILDTFEINYRYFKELDPDDGIKLAGLDDFRLITYHLGLTNNMYIAYSSGELPFNQKDNQIFELGYTYKFN